MSIQSKMTGILAVQASLFEPSNASPMESAAGWMSGLLDGPLAMTLCVIAVALVGFAALNGRLPIRMGARTLVGCFIVFGAPTIASALMWQGDEPYHEVVYQAEDQEPARPDLAPSGHDPYSGASLRRN